jgi:hypothetical protein
MIKITQVNRKLSMAIIERALASGGVLAVTAAVVLVKSVNPTNNGWFPQCPFHAATGLDCPGCGLTRATHAALNGDFAAALDFNLLIILLAPLALYGFLAMISAAVRGRGLPFPQIPIWAAWTFGAVLIVFGVLRNLPFYPFTFLAS